MATSNSPISGVADRYARSLFDLARESGALEGTEEDLSRFERMLGESADLVRLIRSPVFSAQDQERAVAAVLAQAGIGGLAANFIRVVAKNRRLFAVPEMIKAYRRIVAEARGETAAQVTAAHTLTPEQEDELRRTLREVAWRQVAIQVSVDPSLLGGLVVKMGSRQIDTSLKTKLNGLKLALKEVG